MSIGIEVGVFLAYAAGMFLVYVFGRFLLVPVKWLAKLLVNSLIGGAAIVLLNIIGDAIGVFVPLNVMTALIVGILGLPGFLSLIIIFL